MSVRERWVLLGVAAAAVVLVVVDTTRAGSPTTWVDTAVAVLGLVAGVLSLARSMFLGVWRGFWSQRSARGYAAAARGVSWRRRRAMIRAMRAGHAVPPPLAEAARCYAAMRATSDAAGWTVVGLAAVQAGAGGGAYDVIPQWLRLLLVVALAVVAGVVVRTGARWGRIHAQLAEPVTPTAT